MPSVLSNAIRRPPQQPRSERRLAHFLEVAAELIVELGFEATTMTEIAERSGTSIGGLYHYFPDKDAVAAALLNEYRQDLRTAWKPLLENASEMRHEEFAEQLLRRVAQFLEERPAYLKLQEARIRVPRDPTSKKALRMAFAAALRVKNPSLSEERALLAANVAVEIVKGMIARYAEASAREKRLFAAEFKKVLTFYLGSVLTEQG
jgi:AcrR family transcriptional regulator